MWAGRQLCVSRRPFCSHPCLCGAVGLGGWACREPDGWLLRGTFPTTFPAPERGTSQGPAPLPVTGVPSPCSPVARLRKSRAEGRATSPPSCPASAAYTLSFTPPRRPGCPSAGSTVLPPPSCVCLGGPGHPSPPPPLLHAHSDDAVLDRAGFLHSPRLPGPGSVASTLGAGAGPAGGRCSRCSGMQFLTAVAGFGHLLQPKCPRSPLMSPGPELP